LIPSIARKKSSSPTCREVFSRGKSSVRREGFAHHD
jgi:hypothetical protein